MIYRFKKTFIGVGGREYISNPKLSFPEHVKIRRRGTNPRSGQPYTEAGSAFVETSAVAARLCCSASAARQYLHRHGVRFRVVRKGTGPLALYWRRLDVERVLAGREPVRRRVPPCYMDMAGAVSMLGVVRSYVYRLVKKGLLREYRCRMKTARGLRVRCFYHREDLEHVRLHVLQKRRRKLFRSMRFWLARGPDCVTLRV